MQTLILGDGLHRAPLQDATALDDADEPIAALTDQPSVRALETALDLLFGCISFASVYRMFHFWFGSGYLLHPLRHVAVVGVIFSFIATLLLDRSGAYRASGGLLQVRETACILEAATLSMVILLPCSVLFGNFHWAVFLGIEIPVLAAVLILEKHLFQSILGSVRKRGYGLRRVLIYGSGISARMLYSALSRSPKLGLLPVAIVEDADAGEGTRVNESSYRGSRFITTTSAKFRAALIQAHKADIVLLASRPQSERELQAILAESREARATVIFAADSHFVEAGSVDYLDVDGHLIYGRHRGKQKQTHERASRLLDLMFSIGLLVLLAPLLLAIYILVKLDSPGSVFFRQVRIGQGGKPFTIVKFRTMHSALCGYRVSPESSADPRITRVGRWLRKTSLDELPQLLNIARGEMGLVGPRPEMPFIVERYTREQRQRLAVRPGLTGLWQLSADRCRPIHENLHYDLYYLKHRSVFMDVAILFHTLLFAMHGT